MKNSKKTSTSVISHFLNPCPSKATTAKHFAWVPLQVQAIQSASQCLSHPFFIRPTFSLPAQNAQTTNNSKHVSYLGSLCLSLWPANNLYTFLLLSTQTLRLFSYCVSHTRERLTSSHTFTVQKPQKLFNKSPDSLPHLSVSLHGQQKTLYTSFPLPSGQLFLAHIVPAVLIEPISHPSGTNARITNNLKRVTSSTVYHLLPPLAPNAHAYSPLLLYSQSLP